MIRVDTLPPEVSVSAGASFCPGCGERLAVSVGVQDGGSGVEGWTLTVDMNPVASGSTATNETIDWDGVGLGAGPYTLLLAAQDKAGNGIEGRVPILLIDPTPRPARPKPVPEQPEPKVGPIRPSATPSATPTTAPTVTSTAWPTATAAGSGFGVAPLAPVEEQKGPTLPTPPVVVEPESEASIPASANVALWGGAALALIGSATALALDQARRRREAEARQREEMARRNAAADAREEAEARAEAERRRLAAAALAAAAAAEAARREAEERRLAKKEQLLAAQLSTPTPPPPVDDDRTGLRASPDTGVELGEPGSIVDNPFALAVSLVNRAAGWIKAVIRGEKVVRVITAATEVDVTEVGETIRITGPRASRETLGLREYVNIARIENRGLVPQQPGIGAIKGLKAWGVAFGLALNLVADTSDFLDGRTDRHEYAAELTVDTGLTIGISLAAGFVAGVVVGAATGALAANVPLPIVGTVPGAVIGGVAGGLVGLGTAIVVGYGAEALGVRDFLVGPVASLYRSWTGTK